MGYAMPATLSFCMTDGRAVFLDTRRNRYFRLGRALEAVFRTLAASEETRDQDIEPLVRLGVLQTTDEEGVRLNPAAAPAPSRSVVEQGQAGPPSDARLTLEIAQAVAMTWVSLRCSPLSAVVTRHSALGQRWQARGRPAHPRPCVSDIFSLSASFNRTRRILPIDTVCLLDSLALHRFLARHGPPPHLVIGVRLNPFAAHCWVQQDDVVLNDAVERATTYTPILVV